MYRVITSWGMRTEGSWIGGHKDINKTRVLYRKHSSGVENWVGKDKRRKLRIPFGFCRVLFLGCCDCFMRGAVNMMFMLIPVPAVLSPNVFGYQLHYPFGSIWSATRRIRRRRQTTQWRRDRNYYHVIWSGWPRASSPLQSLQFNLNLPL